MTSKYAVKFKHYERVAPIPDNVELKDIKPGNYLVVDTNRGEECGKVIMLCPNAEHKHNFELSVLKVKRVATADDHLKLMELDVKEADLIKLFNAKAEQYNLDITLVGVELTFDLLKVFFHYRIIDAGKRGKPIVNIRPLVQDLGHELKMKVEVREVGVRGEAKLIGGLSDCGKTLCCASWLHKSKPITVKMAKEQGLAINIPKLSGICGRLKCCLSYEKECYHEGHLIGKEAPPEVDPMIKEFQEVFKEETPSVKP